MHISSYSGEYKYTSNTKKLHFFVCNNHVTFTSHTNSELQFQNFFKLIVHTYIHTHIHTYIHTYIHTNKHTHIQTYMHTYIVYIERHIGI